MVVCRRCGGGVSRRIQVIHLRRGNVIHGSVDGTDGTVDGKGRRSVMARGRHGRYNEESLVAKTMLI